MYFFDAENREPKEVAPGIRIRTFWQQQMLIAMVELDANAVLPEHDHPHEQGGVVLSGELIFTIGGETRTCTAGDSYLIPGGVRHSAIAGANGAQVMDVFSPVREEYK